MDTVFQSELVNPGDQFLVNDGTSTSTVTWEEMKKGEDSTMLNDSDKFLVNDGTKTETVTWGEMRQTAGTPPVIGAVNLTEVAPGGDRFTAQNFTTTVTMTEDGNPASTKGIKGWVSATINTSVETSAVTAVSADGLTLTFESSKDLSYIQVGETLTSDTDTATPTWSTMLTAGSGDVKNPADGFNGATNNRAEGAGGLTFLPVPPIPFNTLEIYDTNGITKTQLNDKVDENGDPVFVQHVGNTWVTLQDTPGVLTKTYTLRTDNDSYDAGFTALRIDGTTIIQDGQLEVAVTGVVASVTYVGDGNGSTENTITFSSVGGTWSVGSKALGAARDASFNNYLRLDSALNVLGFQVEEPSSTFFEGFSPVIKFGSTIDGSPVDDLLPPGTNIQTQVSVTNGVGDPAIMTMLSNIVTPTDGFAIDGTMHGLRFDNERGTRLSRNSTGTVDVWTTSYWVKPTTSPVTYNVIGSFSTTNKVFGIANGNHYYYDNVGVNNFATATANAWQHVVISYDNGTTTTYLNGAETNSGTAQLAINASTFRIGDNANNTGNEEFNGYLSDFYFVEQALTPGYFGKNVDGKWAPRSSVDVVDYVKNPSNDSQVWSDNATCSSIQNGSIPEAFDGDLATGLGISNGANALFNFTGVTVTSSLRMFCYGRLNGGPIVVNEGLADEVSIEMDNSNASKWYTIPFTGTLQTIKVTAEDDYNTVSAIEVDSRVLVDTDDTINKNEVWSNQVTNAPIITPGRTAVQMFDNDFATMYQTPDNGATVTWKSTLKGVTSLRCYLNVGTVCNVKVNGGAAQSFSSPGWTTINLTGTPLDDPLIEFYGNNGSSAYVAAWEANGKVLKDAFSFGENGFFLQFSPNGPSQSYIGAATATNVDTDISNLFDGQVSTFVRSELNKVGTIDNIDGIEVNVGDKIEILKGGTNEATDLVEFFYEDGTSVNGEVSVPTLNSYHTYDESVATAGKITKMVFRDSSGGNCTIAGIAINGELLIAYRSIGADLSGEGNNFTDEGFNLGQDVVWSNYLFGSQGGSSKVITNRNYAFNGDLGNRAELSHSAGTSVLRFEPPEPIEGESIRLYVYQPQGTSGATTNININDGADMPDTSWNTVSANGNGWTQPLTIPGGSLTSFEVKLTYSAGSTNRLYAVEVDGVILIDGNITDATKDTPLANYSILQAGKNGNLVDTSNQRITYFGEGGTQYYYEKDNVGLVHIGGLSLSGVSGSTYNFGQQPFFNQHDNSQVWSSGDQTNPDPSNPLSRAFDGSLTTYTRPPGGVTNTFALPVTVPVTKTLEIFINNGASGNLNNDNFKVNGNSYGSLVSTTPQWVTIPESSLSTIAIESNNVDKVAQLYGIKVDGKILIDTDSNMGQAVGNELYQTFDQWSSFGRLYVDDSADFAKFNVIKSALDSLEGNHRQFKADLVKKLVTSGFTLNELDSMGVINIEDATVWANDTGYENADLVTYGNEYWFALSSSYNNSPDDNDPEDWVSLTP